MRTRSSPAWLLSLLAISSQITSAAISFQPAPQSDLDLSQLGRVALVGDFDSLSLYEYVGQGRNSPSPNGSQSLSTRFPNGQFHALTSTDGNIQSICAYKQSGSSNRVVVGGNFTSLGGIEAPGIALYDPDKDQVTSVPGISGRVDALLCDPDSSTVYVGGTFLANDSFNAMAWDGGWKHLPFKGFNGPVKSITKTPSGHILFGGSFSGLGSKTSQKNLTAEDDIKLRQIPLSSARLWSNTDKSSWNENVEPKNLICTTGDEDIPGKVWFGPDNGPASLLADFRFTFTPAKLRLWNTNLDNHGTKTFRFTAFPINGIMNLTYVDAAGATQSCSASCPLPFGDTSYQDFYFVNNVGMNSFRLDLNEWYGAGPGISGIQLYQLDINEYAINDFNKPVCEGGTINGSESQTSGQWLLSEAGISSSQYLTASVPDGPVDPESLTVTITPDITQAGNYSVLIFTPGCIQDGSCSTRGQVTVTATLRSGAESEQLVAEVWQTNNYDKYDRIFFSFVDLPEGSFKPTVTIKPTAGQAGPKTFVAQSIQFNLESATGGLNGLYEFDPASPAVNSDLGASVYNKAAKALARGAEVHALTSGETVYVAGNFTGSGISNVMGIGSRGAFGLSHGGLDDDVLAIYRDDDYVYFGGQFKHTQDRALKLNHLARYHIGTNSWSELGAGVNGAVQYFAPLFVNISSTETVLGLAVSGDFDSTLSYDSYPTTPVNSIAVWLPSKNAWLPHVNPDAIALQGRLTAVAAMPDGDTLYAGDVSSQQLAVTGAAGLRAGAPLRLERIPSTVIPSSLTKSSTNSSNQTSGLARRDQVPLIPNSSLDQGVVTGLMYDQGPLNITVFGGHFEARDSSNNTVHNLLFVNGADKDRLHGLPAGLSTNSVVRALGTYNTNLYIGGDLSGRINDSPVKGMVVYDLQGSKFVSTQPPSLAGEDVSVHAISPSRTDGNIYVGGHFDGAGSFTCPALCMYSVERAQWQNPSGNLNGTVYALSWIDQTRLIVGGDFTVAGEEATVRVYDTAKRTFTPLGGGEAPGRVHTITPATADGSQIFVSGVTEKGETFLAKNDGTSWHTITGFDPSRSTIRGLQVFTTTKDHGKSSVLDANRALLVLGTVVLPDIGPVSGAVFNGIDFTPFALTSSTGRIAGQTGSLSQAFVQFPSNFFTSNRKHLAVGFVVLIGLAISLVLTSMLVAAVLLLDSHRKKKQDGDAPMSPGKLETRENALNRIPPQHLFNGIGKQNPVYSV